MGPSTNGAQSHVWSYLEKIILIFSGLNNYSSLWHQCKVQLVENGAARLPQDFNRQHHTTPVFASGCLHLLEVLLRFY